MDARRLTPEQRATMDAGGALVVHCPLCRVELFLAELPLWAEEVARLIETTRCPGDEAHVLYMGPVLDRH